VALGTSTCSSLGTNVVVVVLEGWTVGFVRCEGVAFMSAGVVAVVLEFGDNSWAVVVRVARRCSSLARLPVDEGCEAA